MHKTPMQQGLLFTKT